MGKKTKFSFLFKKTESSITTSTATSWPWPWQSCGTYKTLSFRATGEEIFKTMNFAYDTREELEDPGHGDHRDSVDAVIKGLRTAERLFFEPGETSSILGELKNEGKDDFCLEKERSIVAVAMDSMDPYADFKRSMEEMVDAQGLKEWNEVEELLGWYLRENRKENHGYIVGAFVDLLIVLASAIASSSSSSSSSDDDDRHDQSFSVITSTGCSLNSSLSLSSFVTSSTSTPCVSSSLETGDEI